MTRSCILALALCAATSLATAAEPQAWDQAKATTAARTLEKISGEIFRSIKTEDGAIQARQNKTFVVAEDIRTVNRFTKRLSRQLSSGAGREETEPLFTRTLTVVDRLRTTMPGTPQFANQLERIREARAQLDVLAPMYGVTLPPPVAAPAPSKSGN